MKMIIFLPPTHCPPDPRNIDDSNQLIPEIDPQRIPKVVIERTYKSKHILAYEIVDEDVVDITLEPETQLVSTQLSMESLQKLYHDLNYTVIQDLLLHLSNNQDGLVNVFAVVRELTYCDQTKCATLLISDIHKHQIITKLWRGLSVWHQSLSPGCRIQIRNLLFKPNFKELHSVSSTEVYLLGSSLPRAQLSARAYNLYSKERELLRFLEEQSILIPKAVALTNTNISLSSPLYLEHRQKNWRLSGYDVEGTFKTVLFDRIDARIWSIMTELFFESDDLRPYRKSQVHFSNLSLSSESFDYLFSDSKSQIKISHNSSCNNYSKRIRKLSWEDLTSLEVVSFGFYEIDGVLDQINSHYDMVAESLGNLSASASPNPFSPTNCVLKCPNDYSKYVLLDGNVEEGSEGDVYNYIVKIKTLLHEGNVDEIVKKSISIVYQDGLE